MRSSEKLRKRLQPAIVFAIKQVKSVIRIINRDIVVRAQLIESGVRSHRKAEQMC